jgi:hypothetical protein
MKRFSLCLCELGSPVDNDVLLLASLTTTHREAGLPTSTAQHGGLHEVGVRGWSLGLRSGNLFRPSMLHGDRRLLCLLGVVSSSHMTLRLALSQAPDISRGWSRQKSMALRFCNPCIGFSQAPEHIEGRVLRHERGQGSAQHVADDCLK